jgi:hypothetical protein
MKRLWRWLFNLLAGVSMLLCVATAVLWVLSYADPITYSPGWSTGHPKSAQVYHEIVSVKGQIVLNTQTSRVIAFDGCSALVRVAPSASG